MFVQNAAGPIGSGDPKFSGGAVLNTYGSLRVSGSVLVTGNVAFLGGGFCCNVCNMQLEGVTVTQNYATFVGAGVFVIENSVASVIGAYIANNVVLLPVASEQGFGAGYFAQTSQSTIQDTTIERNIGASPSTSSQTSHLPLSRML